MNKRASKNIIISKRVLVLCEGESEKIYILGYCNEDANKRRLANVDVEIYQPRNYSPYGLLQEAKRKIKEAKKDKFPYDSAWIVFDRDGHANIPKTFGEAPDVNVKVVFSSVCFETWILLHFLKTSRSFENSDKIISYISKKGFINYEKTNYYNELSDLNKSNALNNAKWLRNQNSTDIDNGVPLYSIGAHTDFDILMEYLMKINL